MELRAIDGHVALVGAPPRAAWDALVHVLPRAFGGRRAVAVALLLGCAEPRPRGPFPRAASALAGFSVARTEAPRLLVLAGEHRFARYELAFRVEPAAGAASVAAATQAAFPGLRGRAYRGLVVGTGAHAAVVRRILAAVRRRAERVQGQAGGSVGAG